MKKLRLLNILQVAFLNSIALFSSNGLCASLDVLVSADGQLQQVDTATGSLTPIGATSLQGMDYDNNGVLYGNTGSSLYTVDPSNGAVTLAAELDINMISIAFSPTGELWGVQSDASTLWQINPSTGALSNGVFFGGAGGVLAMDFAPDGTLYGDNGAFVTIDVTTGISTIVGNTGNTRGFDSLDYGADGVVRGYSIELIPQLYEINPLTGAGQIIGPAITGPPSIGIWAMASSPVPIPSALYLFGSGLLGLIGIARRKKQ